MINFDSQTINKQNKYIKMRLVIGGELYVAWKRKMLHDVIGEHQAYIQRKKDLFIYEASNRPFARWRHFTTTTRILFVFPFIFKFCNPSEV